MFYRVLFLLFSLLSIVSCNEKSDQDSEVGNVSNVTSVTNSDVEVIDKPQVSKGQELLRNARSRMNQRKNDTLLLSRNEDNNKSLSSIFAVMDSEKLNRAQTEKFLLINPALFSNNAELSQEYNRILFSVLDKSPRDFLNVSIKHPQVSKQLYDQLSNPVSDDLLAKNILVRTSRITFEEMKIKVESLPNSINTADLIKVHEGYRFIYENLGGDIEKWEVPSKINNEVLESELLLLRSEYRSSIPSSLIQLENSNNRLLINQLERNHQLDGIH